MRDWAAWPRAATAAPERCGRQRPGGELDPDGDIAGRNPRPRNNVNAEPNPGTATSACKPARPPKACKNEALRPFRGEWLRR